MVLSVLHLLIGTPFIPSDRRSGLPVRKVSRSVRVGLAGLDTSEHFNLLYASSEARRCLTYLRYLSKLQDRTTEFIPHIHCVPTP